MTTLSKIFYFIDHWAFLKFMVKESQDSFALCPWQRAIWQMTNDKGQRAKGKGQRAKGKGQRAKRKGQRAKFEIE